MPRLTEVERNQAIGMLNAGMAEREVGRRFGCHRCTITRLSRRYRQTGVTRDRPRSGQPRVTTVAQDRRMRTMHLRDRFMPATESARMFPGRRHPTISPRTVQRRLRERGIRAYRCHVGMVLTPVRRNNRRVWARAHSGRNWLNRHWRNIMFSDESRFLLQRRDGRQRVYRRRGERFADPCVLQVDRFGGGSVMVWGAIRHGWKSRLVFVDGRMNAVMYRDNILNPHVIPYVTRNPHVTFMHDNARPHVARICMDTLRANNIDVLEWPAFSPDMNPIEHLWDRLDRQVRNRNPAPATLAQLRAALTQEWANIPQNAIDDLLSSMPRRIQALIQANGGHTRY